MNTFKNYCTVLLLVFLQLSCTTHLPAQRGNKTYFPEAGNWLKNSPEQAGMDGDLVQQAVAYAIENESVAPRDLKEAHYQGFGREPFGDAVGPFKSRGEPTGLIIRGGYIVAEWGTPEEVNMTFSVSKSFLSSVVGLAYDDGLIRNLDDLVYPYMAPVIPYQPVAGSQNKADHFGEQDVLVLYNTEHNRKISWNHLLRQTSDWEGTLWGKPDWADRPEGEQSEWLKRERNEPGSHYKYNDVRVNLLALSVMNVWRKPLPQVLKERIMDPIGASGSWRWLGYENSWIVMDGLPMQVVSGGGHWGGGLFISAMDQARFGYLTLRKGNWNGRQLLSEEWISQARTPTKAKPTYGFMNYFLNTNKELYPSAPETAFAHLGAGTNIVYVDPENDLIIVARWIENQAIDGLIARVLESIR